MKYGKLKLLFPAIMLSVFVMQGNVKASPSGEVILEEPASEDEITEEEHLPSEGESELPSEVVLEQAEDVEQNGESVVEEDQIVTPPAAEKTFRFMKIAKKYAISDKKDLSIYEEMDEDSVVVGNLAKRGLLYILSEESDGWMYVESGRVRGFVRSEDIITGDKAEKYIKKRRESRMKTAEELVDRMANNALDYKKVTAYDTLEKKKYAIAQQQLDILDGIPKDTEDIQENGIVLEDKSPSAVGTLSEGGVCYILADSSEKWVYVESGDVRGFVDSELLKRGKEAMDIVRETGEENLSEAEEKIEPEKNPACYYTLTSVKEASVSGLIRSAMIQYAEQFLGNSYVWGGTSLTNGADCSGFVQSIYRDMGYSIPRVAEDQAQVGMKIPVKDAAPGDLIFYEKNGEIYHVVMSLGNGKTIEAQSSATGIVYGNVDYNKAVWAVRIISDEDTDVLDKLKEEGLADVYTEYTTSGYVYGKYLGNFKLTNYCSCPVCCGVWSGGPTASGAMPVEGRTVAMAGVPFGTKLIINGLLYTVEDRGTPYGHVDIYRNSHQDALNFGVQYADVYLAE